MPITENFTEEEKAFIVATQELLASNSESSIFISSIISMGIEALLVDSLISNIHNMQLISNLKYSSDITTLLEYENKPIKCPNCKVILIGDCGRLECRECNKTFFIENKHTSDQCLHCSRYFENMSSHDKRCGRGAGCDGVKGKGNQIIKK